MNFICSRIDLSHPICNPFLDYSFPNLFPCSWLRSFHCCWDRRPEGKARKKKIEEWLFANWGQALEIFHPKTLDVYVPGWLPPHLVRVLNEVIIQRASQWGAAWLLDIKSIAVSPTTKHGDFQGFLIFNLSPFPTCRSLSKYHVNVPSSVWCK